MNEERPKMRTANLSAFFGTTKALSNVTLSLIERRVTAIIGPSGCGKSTFARCLNRMHEVTPGARVEGDVLLDEESTLSEQTDAHELRRRVGMVFPSPNLFPALSLRDNVLAGLLLRGKTPPDADAIVEDALQEVGLWQELKNRLKDSPATLSRGQQQRLCIARCLALDPEVLVLDEPCSALDPVATAHVEDAIQKLAETFTMVVVTPSVQQAARVSDYTAFFYLGELVEYGRADVLFTRPEDPRTEDYITGRFG